MNTFPHVPPGFRFHPTDEELVDYYLRRKITSRRIDLDVIKDIDLYKIEPWDLQELCRIGTEEQNEWYFFSHKDKKYPTGTRTNRATAAGFWKATGRDKAIYSKHDDLIGMRKTLVFYKGRAPNGQKSDWIMHEYRLETDENGAPQEEGWVVSRVFKKRIATTQRLSEHGSPIWYDDHVSFMPEIDNNISPNYTTSCKKENIISLQHGSLIPPHHNHFLQLPLLESCPKLMLNDINPSFGGMSFQTSNINSKKQLVHQTIDQNNFQSMSEDDQVTDWRVLDKFVASQLSQGDSDTFPEKQAPKITSENASTLSSGCHENIDHLWKS